MLILWWSVDFRCHYYQLWGNFHEFQVHQEHIDLSEFKTTVPGSPSVCGGEISRTLKIKLDLNLRKSKGLTSIWQIDVEEVRLAPPTFQNVVSFGGSVSDAKNNSMKLLLKLSPCMLTLRFRVQMRAKMTCGRGQKPPYQSERESSDVNNSWILSRQLCDGKKGG